MKMLRVFKAERDFRMETTHQKILSLIRNSAYVEDSDL